MAKINPRQCCFCSNPANSKEHYFSKWLKKEILNSDNRLPFNMTRHLVWGKDGIARKGKHFNQGHPVTRSVRSVCVQCNTGWMSRLQDRAKATLLPLATGVWPPMGSADYTALASWATMFTMSVDQVESSIARVSIEDRCRFREIEQPLQSWSIRLGIIDTPTMDVWFDHLGFTSAKWYGENWGHITFARLGRLLITTSSISDEEFAFSSLRELPVHLDSAGMVAIWPSVTCSPRLPTHVPEATLLHLIDALSKTRDFGYFSIDL